MVNTSLSSRKGMYPPSHHYVAFTLLFPHSRRPRRPFTAHDKPIPHLTNSLHGNGSIDTVDTLPRPITFSLFKNRPRPPASVHPRHPPTPRSHVNVGWTSSQGMHLSCSLPVVAHIFVSVRPPWFRQSRGLAPDIHARSVYLTCNCARMDDFPAGVGQQGMRFVGARCTRMEDARTVRASAHTPGHGTSIKVRR